MAALPNHRHEDFANALARGETAASAYRAAFGKANRGRASRLQREGSILKRVAELVERRETIEVESTASALKAAEATKTRIVQHLAEIGFSNIADFLDKDGTITAAKLKTLPRSVLSAVQGWECVRVRRGGKIEERLKLKLVDRAAALRLLAVMQRMTVFHATPVGPTTLNYNFSPTERDL